MTLADVLSRRSILALALTSLLTAFSAFAQDSPSESQALIIQPGTVLTARINEALSSDRNQPGDIFSATLTQPVVVHGIVVAQRGQTVSGRVVEANKAGMVTGVSRLKVTLTSLNLVDGQNVPIQSQLLVRNGRTSTDRDAAAIAGTTGVGAAIGAAADWGRGAAIGAGAGAVAGTLGVLLTRGHSTVIYPETLLTFQITQPVTVHTDEAPEAFHAVNPEDYPKAQTEREEAEAPPIERPPYDYPPPYVVYSAPPYFPYYYPYYPYPYFYGYAPYYYGPSFSLFFGHPRFGGFRHFGPRFFGPRFAPRHFVSRGFHGDGFSRSAGVPRYGGRPGGAFHGAPRSRGGFHSGGRH